MMVYATLSLSFLAIVVSGLLVFLTWSMGKERAKTTQFLQDLWRLESQRVQTMLNLTTARDFQTFAGMQSLTSQSQQSEQPTSTIYSKEYIPRDDITEALRLKAFGVPGYGEVIFEDDPELNEALSDLVGGGQIDMGGEDNIL